MWGEKRYHHFAANSFRKRCTKFRQPGFFIRYSTNIFGLLFLDIVYIPIHRHLAKGRLYSSAQEVPDTLDRLRRLHICFWWFSIWLLFSLSTNAYNTRPCDQRVDDGERQRVHHPRFQSWRTFWHFVRTGSLLCNSIINKVAHLHCVPKKWRQNSNHYNYGISYQN